MLGSVKDACSRAGTELSFVRPQKLARPLGASRAARRGEQRSRGEKHTGRRAVGCLLPGSMPLVPFCEMETAPSLGPSPRCTPLSQGHADLQHLLGTHNGCNQLWHQRKNLTGRVDFIPIKDKCVCFHELSSLISTSGASFFFQKNHCCFLLETHAFILKVQQVSQSPC